MKVKSAFCSTLNRGSDWLAVNLQRSHTVSSGTSQFGRQRPLCLATLRLAPDPFGPVLVLISDPFKDYDEPKTRANQKCRSVSKAVTGYKRDHLWLPKFILNTRIKSKLFKDAFAGLKLASEWLDERVHPRMTALAQRPFIIISQVMCLLSGLALSPLEIVPFTSTLIGLAVTLLALGMLARDGLLLVVDCLPYLGIAWLIITLAP